jgi:hypothetical protein
MRMTDDIPTHLLAPCGMNCWVCYVHLRARKPCQGCRGQNASQPAHCRDCKIKACADDHQVEHCGDCATFPCALIKRLDRSYRQRYQVSLIDNATQLKSLGITVFLETQQAKWTCAQCGGVISLHDRVCSDCGQAL